MTMCNCGSQGAGSQGRGGTMRKVVQKGPMQVEDRQLTETGRTGERRTPHTAPAMARGSLGARAGATRALGRGAPAQRRAHVDAGVVRRAAALRGAAAPLHTPSAMMRSHARSNVCAPSVYGSGAGSRHAASCRGRCGRRAHRTPWHIGRRRAHIGLFRTRRSLAERWSVLLVRKCPRVPARVSKRLRVLRRRREPAGRRWWVGMVERRARVILNAQAEQAPRAGAQGGRLGRTDR
jgi:hypothetical protein